MNEFVDHATNSGWRMLHNEFDQIKQSRVQPSDAECYAWQENKKKNRYSNVKCLDSSRVKLTFNVPPESDYINANYIQMKDCNTKFIATQCPLPGTAADFWRMIYQVGEFEVPAILMLCQPEEERQNKSFKYWPTQEQPEKLYESSQGGQISVASKNSKKIGQFVVQTLEILPEGCSNSVRAMFYTNFDWPDGYIAKNPLALLYILKKIREDALVTGPWIVHCSAGRGRTGTLIAIEVVIQRLISGLVPNVPKIVKKMRKMRSQVVTQPVQYIFIYAAVLYYCHNSKRNCTAIKNFQKSFYDAIQDGEL